MRRLVILNPRSRNGAAAREFAARRHSWERKLGPFELYPTRCPGDATEKVRSVLEAGTADQIIVAGGDGTINEAFSGYWEGNRVVGDAIPLGIINLGTGGDFHRSVREFSPDYEEALAANRHRLVDAGMVSVEPGGASRPFLNIASAGMAAEVVRSLKASRFQAGAAGYFYHTLKTLVRYQPGPVAVDYLDEQGEPGRLEADLINLFACNGRFSGGGMQWAPGARLDDGLLRLTLVSGRRTWPLVRHSGKVYQGRIEALPGATTFPVRELAVTCREAPGVETDGEILQAGGPGRATVRFGVMPRVFPLVL